LSTAQTSLTENYDTTKPITLKGAVARLGGSPGSAHAYLLLEVKASGDKTELWVVEGNSQEALAKAGWRIGPGGSLLPGDQVTVTVFHARANAKVAETVPASMPAAVEAAKAGRLVHGTEVTKADGQKLVFGDTR
jgi:hypothetical protein